MNPNDAVCGMVCRWMWTSGIFVWKSVDGGWHTTFTVALHHIKWRGGAKQSHLTIGLIIYYVIVTLCSLYLCPSVQQPIMWYSICSIRWLGMFPSLLDACSMIIENWQASRIFCSIMILDRRVDHKETMKFNTRKLKRKQTLLLLDSQASYWMMLQVVHAHFECIIPCHSNLETLI